MSTDPVWPVPPPIKLLLLALLLGCGSPQPREALEDAAAEVRATGRRLAQDLLRLGVAYLCAELPTIGALLNVCEFSDD